MKCRKITAMEAAERLMNGEPVFLIKELSPVVTFISDLKKEEDKLVVIEDDD